MGLISLPPNPLAMRGRLARCWLVVYRAPIESVQARLPGGLEVVEHYGFGFYHWVVCEVRHMRPAPLPPWMGFHYHHAALRILCRARLADGSMRAGLYFLRSDCDLPPLVPIGNIMTDFQFHASRVAWQENGPRTQIQIGGSQPARWTLDRAASLRDRDHSPFHSVEEAVRLLKYPACALSHRGDSIHALTITRDESRWCSRPVAVLDEDVPVMREAGAELEMAFEVDPIDYQWDRGRRIR
ncbi:MAG: DUF2071 domain-containing protein [Candidatus Methylacidiphilales bacterium]|nr:DUF2071 domain-containing protein [Candidatus Methylacidiphilales bacterium]